MALRGGKSRVVASRDLRDARDCNVCAPCLQMPRRQIARAKRKGLRCSIQRAPRKAVAAPSCGRLPGLRGGPDHSLNPLVRHRAPAPSAWAPERNRVAGSTTHAGGLRWRERYTRR